MDHPITAEITRTHADYVAFSRHVFKRLGVFNYRLIASTLAVLAVFTLQEELSDNPWVRRHVLGDYSGFYIAACVAFYFVLLNVFYRLLTRNVEFIRPGQNFLRTSQFTLDAEGVLETTALSRSFTAWAGISKIEMTKSHLLFYIDRMQAYVLPRRAFATPEECRAFYEQALALWEQGRAATAQADAVLPP